MNAPPEGESGVMWDAVRQSPAHDREGPVNRQRGATGGGPRSYWRYNVRLTVFTMAVWLTVSYVAILFAPQLNWIVILGFPLGYYMGAQGSLIVFVWLIFNYGFKMNRADSDYGVQEEAD